MQKVTVIVPVYGVEKYLRRCLDSLVKQSYEDYEVICVNDCSPDGSQKILEEYKQTYPEKIFVIENEENLGQGRSRMRALSQAKGAFVMFVDSDDYVAEDYIERFMSETVQGDYDVIFAGYTRDTAGKFQEYDVADSPWTLLCQPTVWARLYRKDFLLDNGIDFSDARAGEDIYFSTAVFCQNVKYKMIRYHGYFYYLNRQSTTGRMTYDKKLEDVVSKMFTLLMQKFPIRQLPEEKRRMIEYMYVANMVNALITYGHGCRPRIMREKYQFFMRDLREKFPDYRNNPYFGITRPRGVSIKIRLGVGVTMNLHKMHLDPLIFWLLSWI